MFTMHDVIHMIVLVLIRLSLTKACGLHTNNFHRQAYFYAFGPHPPNPLQTPHPHAACLLPVRVPSVQVGEAVVSPSDRYVALQADETRIAAKTENRMEIIRGGEQAVPVCIVMALR